MRALHTCGEEYHWALEDAGRLLARITDALKLIAAREPGQFIIDARKETIEAEAAIQAAAMAQSHLKVLEILSIYA